MALSVTVEITEAKCLQILVAQWPKRSLLGQVAKILKTVIKLATLTSWKEHADMKAELTKILSKIGNPELSLNFHPILANTTEM